MDDLSVTLDFFLEEKGGTIIMMLNDLNQLLAKNQPKHLMRGHFPSDPGFHRPPQTWNEIFPGHMREIASLFIFQNC